MEIIMAKEYMVGTVDDMPLLKVQYDGKDYFVDEAEGVVYSDTRGLPEVKDKGLIKAILASVKADK